MNKLFSLSGDISVNIKDLQNALSRVQGRLDALELDRSGTVKVKDQTKTGIDAAKQSISDASDDLSHEGELTAEDNTEEGITSAEGAVSDAELDADGELTTEDNTADGIDSAEDAISDADLDAIGSIEADDETASGISSAEAALKDADLEAQAKVTIDENEYGENSDLMTSVKSIAKKIAGLLVVKAAISGAVDNVSEMIQMRSTYQDALGAQVFADSDLTDEVRQASIAASMRYGLDATTYVERVGELAGNLRNGDYSADGAVREAMNVIGLISDIAEATHGDFNTLFSQYKMISTQGEVSTRAGNSGWATDENGRIMYQGHFIDYYGGAYSSGLGDNQVDNALQSFSAAMNTFKQTGDASFLGTALKSAITAVTPEISNIITSAVPALIDALFSADSINALTQAFTDVIENTDWLALATAIANAILNIAGALWNAIFGGHEGNSGQGDVIVAEQVDAVPDNAAANAVLNWLRETYGDERVDGGVLDNQDIGEAIQNIESVTEESFASIVSALQDMGITINVVTQTDAMSTYTTQLNGSHASGLDVVPFDGYVAQLHKGEMILNQAQADEYRSGSHGNNMVLSIDGKAFAAAMSNRMGKNIGNRQLSQLLAMGG